MAGGLFLIAKSTHEIHVKLEAADHEPIAKPRDNLLGTIFQIALLDIVFSLDSVITAVAMAKDLSIMIAAGQERISGVAGVQEKPAPRFLCVPLHDRLSNNFNGRTPFFDLAFLAPDS